LTVIALAVYAVLVRAAQYRMRRAFVLPPVRRILGFAYLAAAAAYVAGILGVLPIVAVTPLFGCIAIAALPTRAIQRLLPHNRRHALFYEFSALQGLMNGDRHPTWLAAVRRQSAVLDTFRAELTSRLIDLAQSEADEYVEKAERPGSNEVRDRQLRREAERLFS
jgi:hypothetical protein